MIPGQLLVEGPCDGAWNMALDEALLLRAEERRIPSLRFYGWSSPTLSLGYFQSLGARREHPPSLPCDLVRRPSGGGAILHHHELTYALALPSGHAMAGQAQRLYLAVHTALVEVLASLGVAGQLGEQAEQHPSQDPPFLCFLRREFGDLLVGDHKIAGSAQRRRRGAVLQHGSLLLARSPFARELHGLQELGGGQISADGVIRLWQAKLSCRLQIEWQPATDLADVIDRAEWLVQTRYGHHSWLARRT